MDNGTNSKNQLLSLRDRLLREEIKRLQRSARLVLALRNPVYELFN